MGTKETHVEGRVVREEGKLVLRTDDGKELDLVECLPEATMHAMLDEGRGPHGFFEIRVRWHETNENRDRSCSTCPRYQPKCPLGITGRG